MDRVSKKTTQTLLPMQCVDPVPFALNGILDPQLKIGVIGYQPHCFGGSQRCSSPMFKISARLALTWLSSPSLALPMTELTRVREMQRIWYESTTEGLLRPEASVSSRRTNGGKSFFLASVIGQMISRSNSEFAPSSSTSAGLVFFASLPAREPHLRLTRKGPLRSMAPLAFGTKTFF